ncbi:MAG: ABC transporter permease [Bacteroidetes bacterium]|nr:MAG: ABC transporter permease [Bacteroidota bacterium]REK06496.1 MAG: ABC transporter permease [Bacteroidota bacterium]REK33262.1 MAG: ABC transporter permease [Bacteroidota bacterium]REK47099.1 MAG: ABC transporter permease [Bacteroidota bacterium]
MLKVFSYVFQEVFRNRMLVFYSLFLFLLSSGLFYFGADSSKAVVSLLHVVLLVVPLLCIVFATIHYYNSLEFIELLLAQPVPRRRIFTGEYLGLSVAMTLALLTGLGLPVLFWDTSAASLFLLAMGVMLTFIFTSIAFFASVSSTDKSKGIGTALIIWFYYAVIFDGLVLLVLHYFSDYPLEKVVLVLTTLNPIDLARVFVLLKLDTSALMGYTGSLFQSFFGTIWGILFSLFFLLLWLVIPLWLSIRIFTRKDL